MNRILKLILLAAAAPVMAGAAGPAGIIVPLDGGGAVSVEAVSPYIFKVTSLPAGSKLPEAAGGAGMEYPGALSATVDRTTGAVTVTGRNFSVTDRGLRGAPGGAQMLRLECTGGGFWTGAGERGHAMTLDGDTLTMYNRANYGYGAGDPRNSQMNISMPLLISSKGYALLFDDFAAATLVAGPTVEYVTENPRPVSYCIIDGSGSMPAVISRLSSLTGRQELPPLWALGYITSKYGYHNNEEMLGALDSLRRDGYPVDGIVLDLYWYGKEQDMGRLAWDPDQWPGHKETLRKAREEYGVNTVLISQPFVLRNGRGADNYNELREKGLLLKDSLGNMQEVEIWVGEGGMFDVSNPDTRRWLADRYRRLTDEGVGGWWGDLGEPERHPESAVHANGLPARLYHNRYGNDWSSILYNLYDSVYPDRRLFTLMRGGTTGLQRYSVFPWSSDVARTWEGMQAQVPVMVHSGLSGLGYMSHDVGGFAVDPAKPSDPEMYLRWMQMGLYSPVLRTHAQYMAEPYHYPEYAGALRALVESRYRLLPYIYTAAYENASEGLPIVRPVWFYEADPEALAGVDDEYLFGGDLLVAPVMHPGVRERKVLFPSGLWVDLYEPSKVYEGGSEAVVAAPLDRIPVFVRAGAFIPVADYEMSNTAAYRTDRYAIEYYPVEGVKSQSLLYDDADPGRRHAPDSDSREITFEGSCAGGVIEIKAHADSPEGGPDTLVFLVNGLAERPRSVTVNGREARFDYNASAHAATVETVLEGDRTLEVCLRR